MRTGAPRIGGPQTREVDVKKSLLTIALCAFQGACASQPDVVDDTGTLLSYSDLATEITVGYEDLAGRERKVQPDDELVDTP